MLQVKANVVYRPQHLEIAGPLTLISQVDTARAMCASNRDLTEHERKAILDAVLSNYYVLCGVTGEQITLSEVTYWNVEKQIPYSSPGIIPLHHFYPHLVSGTP